MATKNPVVQSVTVESAKSAVAELAKKVADAEATAKEEAALAAAKVAEEKELAALNEQKVKLEARLAGLKDGSIKLGKASVFENIDIKPMASLGGMLAAGAALAAGITYMVMK